MSEGERMTPIMQKIADLKSAITRYNRVSANEKCKIAFAYGIITFADEAIEKLEVYLDHLKHNVCHDALPLGMIKEWLENTNWIDKDERLYKELHDYAGKPLSYYRVGLLLDDVNYTDTLHMYKTIVERIRWLLELLHEIETILKAHNPELYENFYHNLRVNYNEKEAVDFMDNWLSHSGIPSLEKYKTFRAEEVIKFIKGDTLDCTGEPSVEEWEKVDIDGFKKQVPLSCQEEEWFKKSFDKRFVIFSRTVRWEGDILVPKYDCAGLFIFQHWNELTEEQINAIFHLDKMLELIHEEIQQLPEAEADPAPACGHPAPEWGGELEDRIKKCIALLMAERFGDEPLFNIQGHWQAVYRILVDKGYCRDSDFDGFDAFIQRVMPDKVNKPYTKASVKQISQTDFAKPFEEWKFDSQTSKTRRPYDRMVAIATRFKQILEENGL